MNDIEQLSSRIRACTICNDFLPLGPRPVIQVSTNARILIVGQAPGIRVHETGIPFNDPSGDRLREWMGINKKVFYNADKVAIIPMGFCYPGTGKSGDLPPRPECATEWRDKLLSKMTKVALTLMIGNYAINWHLKNQKKKTLTETVKSNKDYGVHIMVLPHPRPETIYGLRKTPGLKWISSLN